MRVPAVLSLLLAFSTSLPACAAPSPRSPRPSADASLDARPATDAADVGTDASGPPGDASSADGSSADAAPGSDAAAPADGGPVVAPCCTLDGATCCAAPYDVNCVADTEGCLVREPLRNGGELCDDSVRTALDPALYRYFLVCLSAGGHDRGEPAIGYVSRNSGPPCGPVGERLVARCQCFEEMGIAPWTGLDYVAQLECTRAGQRLEVDLPGAGFYHWGVHPPPERVGTLSGYCPRGSGCMATVGLVALPR